MNSGVPRKEDQNETDGVDVRLSDVNSFCDTAMKAVAEMIRQSKRLPAKQVDFAYYSSFKPFRDILTMERNKCRSLISRLSSCRSLQQGNEAANTDDLTRLVCDSNDQLAERIASKLDAIHRPRSQRDESVKLVTVQSAIKTDSSQTESIVTLTTAKNVSCPKMKFRQFINNSAETPFQPRLLDKYHAKKPLSILKEYDVAVDEADDSDSPDFTYSHPYQFELATFEINDWQHCSTTRWAEIFRDSKWQSVEDTTYTYVDSVASLDKMVDELTVERIIGIDVESHGYRSFQGMTCLIQMSSMKTDYIIDPFPIWAHLDRLNRVTADPQIVKVLHSADSDVMWLQRDFSLYFVNVFDTYIAAKVLGFPPGTRSYAAVVNRYGVDSDVVIAASDKRRYQMIDWRIRPLTDGMIHYARSDSRHLIQVFRRMSEDLAAKTDGNPIQAVYSQSTEICMRKYAKPRRATRLKCERVLAKANMTLDDRQLATMHGLHKWRNTIARLQDESEAYVLPDHMLLKVAIEMPREIQGILACCQPTPALVRQNLNEVHLIVLKARSAAPASAQSASVSSVVSVLRPAMGRRFTAHHLDSGPMSVGEADARSSLSSAVITAEPNLGVIANSRCIEQAPSGEVTPYARYKSVNAFIRHIREEGAKMDGKSGEGDAHSTAVTTSLWLSDSSLHETESVKEVPVEDELPAVELVEVEATDMPVPKRYRPKKGIPAKAVTRKAALDLAKADYGKFSQSGDPDSKRDKSARHARSGPRFKVPRPVGRQRYGAMARGRRGVNNVIK